MILCIFNSKSPLGHQCHVRPPKWQGHFSGLSSEERPKKKGERHYGSKDLWLWYALAFWVEIPNSDPRNGAMENGSGPESIKME